MLCAAGLDHQELKRNDELWSKLEHVDDAYFPPGPDYAAERYEQRTCFCGSTLARKASTNDAPGPEWYARREAEARAIAAHLGQLRRPTVHDSIESAARAACREAL